MIREFVNTEDLMKHYIKNKINTFIKSSHWYNEVLFKDCVKFWEMKEGAIGRCESRQQFRRI